jgi:hypothetical protein
MLDRAESNLTSLKHYISALQEVAWSHPNGDKGMSFAVPEKDIPMLEQRILALNWKIVDQVKVKHWWSGERAFLPNWRYADFGIAKKSKFDCVTYVVSKNFSNLVFLPYTAYKTGLIAGVDIFWAVDDVLKYISLYDNAPPIDIKKPSMTLRVDMTREDPITRILSAYETKENEMGAFARVLPELIKSEWSIVDVPAFTFAGQSSRIERVMVPSWVDATSVDLNMISSLDSHGKEFFTSQQSVLRYLRVSYNMFMVLHMN